MMARAGPKGMRSVPQPAASMAMQAATLFLFALVVGCSCAQADRKSSQPGNIRDNVVTVAVTPQYDHSFGECTASSDCAARTGVPGCSACVHSKLFDMYTKCSWRCCACDPGYGYTSTVVWGNATVKDFTALAAHMKTPDLSKVDITLAAFVCSKCTSNSWSSGGNSPCMECECNSDTPADGSNVCGKVRSGTCNSTTGACSLQTVPSGMKCGDKGTCRDGICVCSKGYGGPSCAACKPGTYSVGGGAAVCEKVPVCKAATGCAVGQSPACTKVKNLPNGTPCKLAGDLRSEYTCKAGICDVHVVPLTTYYVVHGPSAGIPSPTPASLRKWASAVYNALSLARTGYSVWEIKVTTVAGPRLQTTTSQLVLAVTFSPSNGLPQRKELISLLNNANTTVRVADQLLQTGYPMRGYTTGQLSIAICNIKGSARQDFVPIGSPSSEPKIDKCSDNGQNGGCEQLCSDTPTGPHCSCNPGYILNVLDNRTCTDTNECAVDNGGCQHYCNNSAGSFVCSCKDGYAVDPNNHNSCIDIDECTWPGQGGCEQGCVNTRGNYNCTCMPGYLLNVTDGHSCIKLSLCPADCQQVCTNTSTSHVCSCNAGFQLAADSKSCSDIDECLVGNGGCSYHCSNTLGSHECSCPSGYVLDAADKRSCVDINECLDGNGGCSHDCVNQAGIYICTCPAGYRLGADGRTCMNVDECSTGANNCQQVCTDTQGSYVCSCYTGTNYQYISASRSCVCPTGTAECDGNQSNGCEDLTSTQFCGDCSTACTATEACCDGQCLDVVSLTSDAGNCGTCGNACPLGQSCCAGECSNVNSDGDNCGLCGNACPTGYSCCGGQCTAVTNDTMNCGSCGTACPTGQSCCGGQCLNLTSDAGNCGTCGNACAPGNACCGGNCNDVTRDVTNCGSCGNICQLLFLDPLFPTGYCSAGTCVCDPANAPCDVYHPETCCAGCCAYQYTDPSGKRYYTCCS